VYKCICVYVLLLSRMKSFRLVVGPSRPRTAECLALIRGLSSSCAASRSDCALNNDAVWPALVKPSGRFWSRKIMLDTRTLKSFETVDASIKNSGIDLSGVVLGSIMFPSLKLTFPINYGIVQHQNSARILDFPESNDEKCTAPIETSEELMDRRTHNEEQQLEAIITSCSPRSSLMMNADPSLLEREIDHTRYEAINMVLMERYNITEEDLTCEDMEGTPPARIYRSFIRPRNKVTAKTRPVPDKPNSKMIDNAAYQIDFAMRQYRADKASYLRNNDNYNDSPSEDTVRNSEENVSIADQDSSKNAAKAKFPIALVLDSIRSALNVGSLFRTAETGGVAELITVGITVHPPNNLKLLKTALTSINYVKSRHFNDILEAATVLKEEGYAIYVLETTSRSEIYDQVSYPEKVALVVGNELTGVDTRLIEMADKVIEIPTFGIKNSLNVVSAATVVMYEVIRQKTRIAPKT
jgi:23S rRNA (guanosine2251-2'-O)-methyltransferase